MLPPCRAGREARLYIYLTLQAPGKLHAGGWCGADVLVATCLILKGMSGTPDKTFYLETFGCQMNVHDSEKVIGTLVRQGYRQVPSVEEAGLILYNTCSIRDKAEQKVFHRLAEFRKLQEQGEKVGVRGWVGRQE